MNEEQKKSEKAGIELPQGLRDQIKIVSTQRGMKMKDAFEQAIRAWLDPGTQIVPKSPGNSLAISVNEEDNQKLTEQDRKFVRMLLAVLLSDHPKSEEARDAVRPNLKLFYSHIGGDPERVDPVELVPTSSVPPAARAIEMAQGNETPPPEPGADRAPAGNGSARGRREPPNRRKPSDPRNREPLPGTA